MDNKWLHNQKALRNPYIYKLLKGNQFAFIFNSAILIIKLKEGKVIITNGPLPGFLKEGKDCLEESFADSKDDLASGNTTGTRNKEITHAITNSGCLEAWKLKGDHPAGERKTTDSKEKRMVPKIAR